MSRETRLILFVATIVTVSCISGTAAWSVRLPFPGWWPIATLLFVATLLEGLQTRLRVAAKGSTSFIIHMASALLFGAWWAAIVAVGSSLLDELARGSTGIKRIFNVSQRALAIILATTVYGALGGGLPPAYLDSAATLASQAVQRDLGFVCSPRNCVLPRELDCCHRSSCAERWSCVPRSLESEHARCPSV